MDFLINPLPETVEVGGAAIPFNWDFITSLKFIRLMQRGESSESEMTLEGLRLYYPDLKGTDDIFYRRVSEMPDTELSERCLRMIEFFREGDNDPEGETEKASAVESSRLRRALCYEYDAHRIYAAFMTQYRIDLTESAPLHWWKFRALFDGLGDDVPLKQIMRYRAADLSKLSSAQRNEYRKMQEIYKIPDKFIPDTRTRMSELDEILASGGDVSAYLRERE